MQSFFDFDFFAFRCQGGEWIGDRGRFFLLSGGGGGGISIRGGTTLGLDGAGLGASLVAWVSASIGGWLAAGLGSGTSSGNNIGGGILVAAMAPASPLLKAASPIWSHNQCNLQSIWNRPSSAFSNSGNSSGGKLSRSGFAHCLGIHIGRPTHAPDTGKIKYPCWAASICWYGSIASLSQKQNMLKIISQFHCCCWQSVCNWSRPISKPWHCRWYVIMYDMIILIYLQDIQSK